jgi:hypothetical protein
MYRGKIMNNLNILFSVFLACFLFIGSHASAETRKDKLTLKTLRCEHGMIFHPDHLSVSIFDRQKIPKIMQKERDLKMAIASMNSDPGASQKAEGLYEELQKLVQATPALVRINSLPKSNHILEIPSVPRVIIFAFEESEFEEFDYATAELDISPTHPNIATLNFSSDEECKNARETLNKTITGSEPKP